MSAVVAPLLLEQGAYRTLVFTWSEGVEVDGEIVAGDPYQLLSEGWTARLQVRQRQGKPVVIECTTENAKIVLGDSTNNVVVHFHGADTALLTHKSMAYDLELVGPDDEPHRVLEGPVTVTPNITQADGEPVLKA